MVRFPGYVASTTLLLFWESLANLAGIYVQSSPDHICCCLHECLKRMLLCRIGIYINNPSQWTTTEETSRRHQCFIEAASETKDLWGKKSLWRRTEHAWVPTSSQWWLWKFVEEWTMEFQDWRVNNPAQPDCCCLQSCSLKSFVLPTPCTWHILIEVINEIRKMGKKETNLMYLM